MQLQLQWQRSMTLAEILKILDQIQRVRCVRERVADKVAKRQFVQAVDGAKTDPSSGRHLSAPCQGVHLRPSMQAFQTLR